MIKDIRVALRAFLHADTAIAALAGIRIFELRIPQGVLGTSLVYQRISSVGDNHMQGPSGLMMVRMQIAAWSEKIDIAEQLANAVQERLDGFRGHMPLPTSPATSIHVRGIFFEGDNPPDRDDELKMSSVGRDYMIHYAQR